MRAETLDLGGTAQPGSLRPKAVPGFPIRALDPSGAEEVVLAGRRAVARGDVSRGIANVSVDGQGCSVRSARGDLELAPAPPDVVEAGTDRLYRRWSQTPESFEELWVVPLAYPFVVYRWQYGGEHGGRVVWQAPDDASAASRLRKIAASWPAIDGSWRRDVSECASLEGPAGFEHAWAWSRARLLSSVRTGPERSGVRGGGPADRAAPLELAWIALGLSCVGRSDLSPDLLRKITDLNVRSHVDAWVNRWLGRSDSHPDEEAEAFPEFLNIEGRTDSPLEDSLGSHFDPLRAAAFCGRLVDRGLGLRPDSQFGRVRFGPSEQFVAPLVDAPIRLSGLCVGRGQRAMNVSVSWAIALDPTPHVTHTLQVIPDSGALPLQLIFEPLLRLSAVESVSLDDQPVQAEVSEGALAVGNGDGGLRLRLQCPLDGPRTLRITGTPS